MSTEQLTIDEPQGKPEAETVQGFSGPVTIIEPPRGWLSLNVGELWRYRDLLFLLVRRDFAAQYRQSVLGVGWAFFNPVFTMILNVIVFSKMAKFPSDGIPYPVFNYAALLAWEYFAGCLQGSSSSVVGGTALIKKVYFPRLILPLTKIISGLITFGIRFLLLLAMMAWYGITPTWAIVTLPLFLLLAAMAALSVGLWITAIDVKYRDIRRLLSPMTRFWMFATPIVYSISLVPEKWRTVYSLNPMVGVVEGFRWAMLGKAAPDWTCMAISTAVTLILLLGGLFFFRRTEGTFADVI
jgi:lipopolysaccharide transport system permease protein